MDDASPNPPHLRTAVFLDRDGTLIRDVGYLCRVDQVELLPGVADALVQLRKAGFLLIVVSNQSGVARGLVTEDDVRAANDRLESLLRERGATPDAMYYCPFLAGGTVLQFARESDERKPAPGMLLRAAREHDIDLARSYMIGDSPADVEAGLRAGCRTIQLPPAETDDAQRKAVAHATVRPHLRAASLSEAAEMILREQRQRR